MGGMMIAGIFLALGFGLMGKTFIIHDYFI